MGPIAAGRPLGGRAGREPRRSSLTPRSILQFSPYIGAVAAVALLIEAGWYWYALGGASAPASSGANRDPLAAAFSAALLVVLAATLVAGRSLGRRGTLGVSLDVAVVLEFGLLTLVTWALTTLGVTTNLPGSDHPQAARDMPLFFISVGLAFGAGLVMMLDRITRT